MLRLPFAICPAPGKTLSVAEGVHLVAHALPLRPGSYQSLAPRRRRNSFRLTPAWSGADQDALGIGAAAHGDRSIKAHPRSPTATPTTSVLQPGSARVARPNCG